MIASNQLGDRWDYCDPDDDYCATAPDDDYEEADDVPQERDAMDIAHEYAEQCQVEEELAQ